VLALSVDPHIPGAITADDSLSSTYVAHKTYAMSQGSRPHAPERKERKKKERVSRENMELCTPQGVVAARRLSSSARAPTALLPLRLVR
jgi:hypothetical protein